MIVKNIHLPFDVPLLPIKVLRSGPLSCVYEHGSLRYIKLGGVEVVRMIYTAVRDENWHTAPYQIEDEKIEEIEAGFKIGYTAIYRFNQVHYKAFIQIEAQGNTISFRMKGIALTSFSSNRIGICVHHPLNESSGKEVTIKKPDGAEFKATFPDLISPHQPFKQVQQMQWQIDESNTIQLNFEGDVFETEDQRNWTDSSFKTYSTPLDIAFPVDVKVGDTVEQQVVLSVWSKKLPAAKKLIVPSLQHKIRFPKIGYCRVKEQPLTSEQIQLLKALPFNHYRVELELSHHGWKQELDAAVMEAKQLNTRLELVVFFIDDQLKIFVEAIEVCSNYIESILMLHSQQKLTVRAVLQKLYPLIKEINPAIKIGYGTNGNFSELNRNLPLQSLQYDFVSFSINPQVHANDTRTLIENLEAQSHTLQTLQTFIGSDKAVHISPVTFNRRLQQHSVSDDFLTDYDERLQTNFGTVWTLITLRNLANAHITLYDTVGYGGIISTHNSFKNVSPLYKALAEIKASNPVWVLQSNDQTTANIIFENVNEDQLSFSIDPTFMNCTTFV